MNRYYTPKVNTYCYDCVVYLQITFLHYEDNALFICNYAVGHLKFTLNSKLLHKVFSA